MAELVVGGHNVSATKRMSSRAIVLLLTGARGNRCKGSVRQTGQKERGQILDKTRCCDVDFSFLPLLIQILLAMTKHLFHISPSHHTPQVLIPRCNRLVQGINHDCNHLSFTFMQPFNAATDALIHNIGSETQNRVRESSLIFPPNPRTPGLPKQEIVQYPEDVLPSFLTFPPLLPPPPPTTHRVLSLPFCLQEDKSPLEGHSL